MKVLPKILILFCVFCVPMILHAHPTGNMVVIGESVLWSYIDPIDDPDHHACVMIWSEGEKARPLITSEYPSSDFMIFAKNETIYLIERRFVPTIDSFEVRLLKTDLSGRTEIVWPWFKDVWRIGEGGFSMQSDTEMVFCKYPDVFVMRKGEDPRPFLNLDLPIKRMRFLNDGNMLLLSDDRCWLTDQKGTILEKWEDLTEEVGEDPFLGRNEIFDVDYQKGNLLVAYWGKRSFYRVDSKGHRKIIEQLKEPFVPHWVAFFGNKKLMFASKMALDGSTPKPRLVIHEDEGANRVIWAYE